MKIQQKNDTCFYKYPQQLSNDNEIDLLEMVDILWKERIKIILIILVFSGLGLFVSLFLPQRWTSSAIVIPPEYSQLKELDNSLTNLRVLGMSINISRDELFKDFIKKFQSVDLLEAYLRSSPYVIEHLKNTDLDKIGAHRFIVTLSENMKAVDETTQKKNEQSLYTYWRLSFTAPTSAEAQNILSGYISYVSDVVAKEFIDEIRSKVDIKINFDREALAQDKMKMNNQLKADIRRLAYSLEVANAAGIKKPVFGNGQSVKDDPDFSVSLGSDGIASKLNIKKSISDVTELSGELMNRQYIVNELSKISFRNIEFSPFKYQLSPSLPVKKDGVGTIIIVLVSSLIGGMIACGSVLLHHAMASRKL